MHREPQLDPDGYPTDDTLKIISEWPWEDGYRELLEYIKPIWKYANSGYWDIDTIDTHNKVMYHLSTAGWSGNESIIAALEENRVFWAICWYSSKRGGHYVFDLSRDPKREKDHDSSS